VYSAVETLPNVCIELATVAPTLPDIFKKMMESVTPRQWLVSEDSGPGEEEETVHE
jgi:hypothetical protein